MEAKANSQLLWSNANMERNIGSRGKNGTWTTETREMEVPVKAGGLDSLELGLAEYAAGEAERTFNT